MSLKEFAESLTPAQIDELATCKTADEIIATCRKEGLALPDEALEAISGGVGSAQFEAFIASMPLFAGLTRNSGLTEAPGSTPTSTSGICDFI